MRLQKRCNVEAAIVEKFNEESMLDWQILRQEQPTTSIGHREHNIGQCGYFRLSCGDKQEWKAQYRPSPKTSLDSAIFQLNKFIT